MWRLTRLVLGGAALSLAYLEPACGGHASAVPAADSGTTDSAASVDAPPVEAGPPPRGCVSDSGFAICDGTHNCFPPSQRGQQTACWDCVQGSAPYYQTVLCLNEAAPMLAPGSPCADGQVLIEAYVQGAWNCLPFDVGQLFTDNGAADRVRYADWSAWTGEALPLPTTCPKFSGFSICGGNCGPCGSGNICTGRSPKHPYGFCFPDTTQLPGCGSTDWTCPSGQSCVVFADPGDQALADQAGLCVSTTACKAMASSYPGGANCH